jgi:replicative DNA helicase
LAEKLLNYVNDLSLSGDSSNWLRKTLESGYQYDEVAKIECGESETVDFTIPGTHSFFANGMISHNSGKSFALAHSAAAAVLTGYNVLYITLENSREVTTDRFDSYMADIVSNSIDESADIVLEKIQQLRSRGKVGKFFVHEYPTSTFKPQHLKTLVKHYAQKSVKFDVIVIDYLDIMAPNIRNTEHRDNSRETWEAVRAIAQEENAALISATQTNREGFRADVAGSTHVAEDINKIRTADLVISINRTDEEKKAKKARLHFAAGRNQEDGITITIKQDLSRAKFLTEVLNIF